MTGLMRGAFGITEADRQITLLSDLPRAGEALTPRWKSRLAMAGEWTEALRKAFPEKAVRLVLYPNVGSNNADLPDKGWAFDGKDALAENASQLAPEKAIDLKGLLAAGGIVVAITQLSATAPLKILAKRTGLRGATMPGFHEGMASALRLDFAEIKKRCSAIKALLDEAEGADVVIADKASPEKPYALRLDLRHRSAHLSTGVNDKPGEVGNLPSGETYIVPYEGEAPGDKSRSEGLLPVEINGEVVVYRIVENRAVEVLSAGPESLKEAEHLRADPAYGNMAEAGFGVLAELGARPLPDTMDNILLNEKLGFHVAFGRSDHFGGQVGPKDFRSPESVIHLDRIYVPQMQPRLNLVSVTLRMPGGKAVRVLSNGVYEKGVFGG
jgi:hypothetical protein